MLIQALSVISGLLFLTGIILATNFTVAKNIANQKLGFALQTASSQALNDAQTWARDSLALSDQENEPILLQPGSGSSQFGCVDTNCSWLFRDRWIVTGSTVNAAKLSTGSIAQNLEPALGEGRLSITVTASLYKTLANPLRAISSRSFDLTARYLNSSPYFVVTASNEVTANLSMIARSEGDTGGTIEQTAESNSVAAVPSVAYPASDVDTTLRTQITCVNSKDAQHSNPTLDVPSEADIPKIPQHSYVPNDETLVWIYEAPCNPPNGAIVGLPTGTEIPSANEYEHSGDAEANWIKGDSASSDFVQ